jgi:ParB family transcriptional regulator, chromosome partitioning protein
VSNKGLGRGFASLLPEGVDTELVLGDAEKISNIDLTLIDPNPNQPRTIFNDFELKDLANSITELGVLQPIVVTKQLSGRYEIVAGERRFRASKLAHKTTVPCVVRSHDQLQKLEVAISENIQRTNLNPMDLSNSLFVLRDQFGMTNNQLSQKLGKAVPTIVNLLRLQNASPKVKQALINEQISENHAKVILNHTQEDQDFILAKILKDSLTVAALNVLVHSLKASKTKIVLPKFAQSTKHFKMEQDLQEKLKAQKAQIIYGEKLATLKLQFLDKKTLDSFVKTLL